MEEKPALVNTVRASTGDNVIPGLIDQATEKTLFRTGVDPSSQYNPWNPDDLYQKRASYSIYEQMMNDDQVSVAVTLKKDLVIGSGFHIVTQNEDQQEMRRELECVLNDDPEIPFEDSLLEILTAYEFGFSVSEKQFKLKPDGGLTLKSIKTRNPVSWLFHQDKFGNVVRYEQQGADGQEFLDIDKSALIHFVNNPRFCNPYGTSDLRSAYAAYFIKTQIVKFYAIFLEKAASPIPKAKYDSAATQAEIDAVYNAIKKFQTSTAIVYPHNFELDFLETTGDHGSSYINGINMMNMFIGRALFVPDLLGFQGGPTTGGSQALGREQMVVFFKHIMRRRRAIERMVNKEIIAPILKWNYGDVENPPEFRFKPIEDVQAERNARLWLEAVKGRTWAPTLEEINHFKKIIEFPETDESELDPIEEEAASVHNPESDPDPEPEEKTTSGKSEENRERSDYAAEKKYDLPAGNYAQKTDFSAIEKQLDSDLDLLIAESEPLLKEIIDQYAADLRARVKVPDVSKLGKLDALKFRPGLTKKLVKLLDKSLVRSFDNSQKLAQKEVVKSTKDTYALLPADEFLEVLESENFNFVKDWEYNLTKEMRVKVIAAIKDGMPISSVVDKDVLEAARVSIDRYARTKFTEVMNKGRLAFFESTGAVAAYQYAAILDDRTTDLCSQLHSKIFLPDDAPVPPTHWNCRSTLVPITIYESFEPSTEAGGQDIQKFIEENLGKGFPKQ